jgi:MSHA biogenesis protein MshL
VQTWAISGRRGVRGLAVATLTAVACLGHARAQGQTPLPSLPVSQMSGGGQTPGSQPPRPPDPQLPSLPVTRLDDRSGAQLDGPPLTINFPRPQTVQDVLKVLVAGTPFSVVTDPDVTGTYSGELKDVTMRQALDALLVPLGLDYEVRNNVIRVFRRRHATRLYDVNLLNVRRSAQRAGRSSVTLQGQPAAAALASATGSDIFDEIARGVQALLSPGGRMNVDRGAGLVQVTDFDDRLDQVGVYLEAVQLRATRQVRIEAHVIEVTLNDAARASIDWDAALKEAGAGSRRSPTAGVKVRDIRALLDAIAKQGTVRAIAAPDVLAMNNEPALMRVGTQEVSFDVAAVSKKDDRATPGATALFAGLTLLVTPQIAADGIVQISVSPTFSEKSGQVRSPGGGMVPVLTISEADTIVRVQEGETIVISGLLQDRTRVKQSTGVSGVFGGQTKETIKAELVVFLTPTVVMPGVPTATGGGR